MGREVRAEIMGSKIGVKTLMHWESGRTLCQSIPGGKWDPTNRLWKYPLDMIVCTELRRAATEFDSKLDIGHEVWKWATAEKARLAALPDATSQTLVELPRLADRHPDMWNALTNRPFQTVGVDFLTKQRAACLGDDPGLGKTLQTIATVCNAMDEGCIIVIAPKSAAGMTWPNEIRRWVGADDHIINFTNLANIDNGREWVWDEYELNPKTDTMVGVGEAYELMSVRDEFIEDSFESLKTLPGRKWLIIGEHWVKVRHFAKASKGVKAHKIRPVEPNLPELFDVVWDAIILDESHKIVIANTTVRDKHTQARYGLDELRLAPEGLKLPLSGTPMRGKAENMWGTLNWMYPKRYTSYWNWMDLHFESTKNYSGYGGSKIYGGLKNSKQFYESMKDVFIRRTKQEVASDLPAIMYGGEHLDPDDPTSAFGVWIEMTEDQRRQADAMIRDAEVDGLIANGILSEWTRLKQIACSSIDREGRPIGKHSNKWEWIEEFLDDRGILDKSADGKVIIASQFSRVIDMYAKHLDDLKVPYFKLTGDTSMARRIEMGERFQQAGGRQIFLLTTTAGGVSITLDAADDVIISDETWIPDDQRQVENRAHRISRVDHQVNVWYLRSRGSIEEAIAVVTGGRDEVLVDVMDRSRGVEIRKSIVEYAKKKATAKEAA